MKADQMAVLLHKLSQAFNLHMWEIRLSEGDPLAECDRAFPMDAAATVKIIAPRYLALIDLAPSYPGWSYEDSVRILTHELVHVMMERCVLPVRDLDAVLSRDAYEMLYTSTEREFEFFTDHISTLMATQWLALHPTFKEVSKHGKAKTAAVQEGRTHRRKARQEDEKADQGEAE